MRGAFRKGSKKKHCLFRSDSETQSRCSGRKAGRLHSDAALDSVGDSAEVAESYCSEESEYCPPPQKRHHGHAHRGVACEPKVFFFQAQGNLLFCIAISVLPPKPLVRVFAAGGAPWEEGQREQPLQLRAVPAQLLDPFQPEEVLYFSSPLFFFLTLVQVSTHHWHSALHDGMLL